MGSKSLRWRPVLRLFRLIQLAWSADRRYLVIGGLAQVVYAVTMSARVVIVPQLIRDLASPDRASFIESLALIAALFSLGGYAQLVQREKGRLLGELASRAALERVLDTAQTADLTLFDESRFHDQARRAHQAQSYCSQAVTALFSAAGAALGAIGVLLALTSVTWLLLPLALLTSLPVAFASRFNSDDEYLSARRLVPSERQRFYIESLLIERQPAKEIRAFDLSPFLRMLHRDLLDKRLAALHVLAKRRMHRLLVSSVLGSSATAAIAAVLMFLYYAARMSLATAGAAIYGLAMLKAQLTNLSRSGTNLYESLLFVADIEEFVHATAMPTETAASLRAAPRFEGVAMEDVVFTYPTADRPALNGVSLHLIPGQFVAFVGSNGSGKTTAAKLLAGLYLPERGRVLWGGLDTATLEPQSLRDQVAIGFQDFERFRMSVHDNIGVGRYAKRHLREEVVAAAEQAGVRDFSDLLPKRLDTPLGPEFLGGHELSQGQWQRLALARVFFRDAPLVILDEPTAALDAVAEFELFEMMRHGLNNRCAVVISHRLATVRTADRIYVFRGGRIAECGTHAELLQRDGIYAHMFELQARSYFSDASAERVEVRSA